MEEESRPSKVQKLPGSEGPSPAPAESSISGQFGCLTLLSNAIKLSNHSIVGTLELVGLARPL